MNKKQRTMQCILGIVIVFGVLCMALFCVIYCKKQAKTVPLKQAIEYTCFEKDVFADTPLETINNEQLADQLLSQLELDEEIPQQIIRKIDKNELKQDLMQQIEQLQQYKLLSTESSKDDPSRSTLSTEAKAHLANALGSAVTKQVGNQKVSKTTTTVSDIVDVSKLEKDVKDLKDTSLEISYKDYGISQASNDKTRENQSVSSDDDFAALRLKIDALDTLVNSIKNTPVQSVSTEELKLLQSQFDSKVTNLQSQIHSLNNELKNKLSTESGSNETIKSIQSQISSLSADIQRTEASATYLQKNLQDFKSLFDQQLDEKQASINQLCTTLQEMQKQLTGSVAIEQLQQEITTDFDGKISNINQSLSAQIKEIHDTVDASFDAVEDHHEKWVNEANITLDKIQNELNRTAEQNRIQNENLLQKLNTINESCVWLVDICLSENQWRQDTAGYYFYEYRHPSIHQNYTNIYIEYRDPTVACGMNYEQSEGCLKFMCEEKPDTDLVINSMKIEQPRTEDIL